MELSEILLVGNKMDSDNENVDPNSNISSSDLRKENIHNTFWYFY